MSKLLAYSICASRYPRVQSGRLRVYVDLFDKRSDRRGFTPSQRQVVGWLQRWKCASCDILLAPGYHIDHIERWTDRTYSGLDNVQALCPECHNGKTSMENMADDRDADMGMLMDIEEVDDEEQDEQEEELPEGSKLSMSEFFGVSDVTPIVSRSPFTGGVNKASRKSRGKAPAAFRSVQAQKAWHNYNLDMDMYYMYYNPPGETKLEGKWDEQETNLLISLVLQSGAGGNWGLLSSWIYGRTGFQVKKFYLNQVCGQGLVLDDTNVEMVKTKRGWKPTFR